ncbi:zinc-binding dehydrogenase [Nocardia carnea]|uniref:zinc-binding dehydrogenase n=1 Tax=Nocardia carnea TaxID=37328 RepID=UPI002454C823|nr:zinc-binding dehydrogenase [Nocardia carnea]
MRALVVDHSVPAGLRLGDAPVPELAPHQALVRVMATSLNDGEIRYVLKNTPDGAVLGWDAAGVVEKAAADGSGPAVGTLVVTLGAAGAWAELRAVDTDMLGVVPDGADMAAISTIPVAGLTALRALHRLGPILGRKVLVTGATGGTGRYAVQLARLAGAHVVATTGNPDAHGESLRALGAHQVITDPTAVDTSVDGVVDLIGGRQLVDSFHALTERGTLVAVGHAANEGEQFPFGSFFGDQRRHDRSIVTFFLLACTDLAPDLTWLASQVTSGTLDPNISWRGDWSQAADAANALLERRLHGKAMLEFH